MMCTAARYIQVIKLLITELKTIIRPPPEQQQPAATIDAQTPTRSSETLTQIALIPQLQHEP